MSSTSEQASKQEQELARFQPTAVENRRALIISSFYIAVCILVGIPMWIKTTATYQAPLPFKTIHSLYSHPVHIRFPVYVISLTESVDLEALAKIDFALQHSNNAVCGSTASSQWFRVSCAVRTMQVPYQQTISRLTKESASLQEFLFKVEDLLFNAANRDTHDICSNLGPSACEDTSAVYIFLLPHEPRIRWPEASSQFVSHSLHRNLFHLFVSPDETNPELLAAPIAAAVNSVLSIQTLEPLIISQSTTTNHKHVGSRSAANHLPPSTVYDMTVTLVSPPSSYDAANSSRDWVEELLTDPSSWLETRVHEAFRSWSPHVRFSFYSQRIYAVDIESLMPSHLSADRTYRYYSKDDLSNLVNHLESYLGAPHTASSRSRDLASTKPGLHLILLLGTASKSTKCSLPLRFHLPRAHSPNQSPVVTNVATVPRWGGLFAIDPSCALNQSSGDLVGKQMVALINELLGVNASSGVTRWELDSWFLHRTVESLIAIRATMMALVNLLSKFPNMVINDFVAAEVSRAVRVWSDLMNELNSAESLIAFGPLFTRAQDALASINSAFFDHTLLGRLYFQEDQKFGIYVPLFVPIGMALLMSAKSVYRIVKQK